LEFTRKIKMAEQELNNVLISWEIVMD
jgi:hypothetical protein